MGGRAVVEQTVGPSPATPLAAYLAGWQGEGFFEKRWARRYGPWAARAHRFSPSVPFFDRSFAPRRFPRLDLWRPGSWASPALSGLWAEDLDALGYLEEGSAVRRWGEALAPFAHLAAWRTPHEEGIGGDATLVDSEEGVALWSGRRLLMVSGSSLWAEERGSFAVRASGLQPSVGAAERGGAGGKMASSGEEGWSQSRALPEVWVEWRAAEGGLELHAWGLSPQKKGGYALYIRAGRAFVGREPVPPRSLKRFAGKSGPVTFEAGEKSYVLEAAGVSTMELVPVAGDDSFLGASYLLFYPLNHLECKLEIKIIDA